MSTENLTMEKIISLAKRRGFVYPGSEIYGGMASFYDYGPVGALMKYNIKNLWLREMAQKNKNIVEIDGAIITHPKVWEASGHVESFSDPLVDCKECQKRFRVDHLIEDTLDKCVDGFSLEEMTKILEDNKIVCPSCKGELMNPRAFNLLVEAALGVVADSEHKVYLRGETCQSIYLNFKNVKDTARQKIPFGIAQVGKAFRNEITLKNFIFRMREFEQMELQLFVHPDDSSKYYQEWKERRMNFHKEVIGLKEENLRWRQHTEDERAHYAADAWDIEFKFPFGFKEMEGVHDRGDRDLSRHMKYSKQDLMYFDDQKNEKYIPYIVETSVGADRLFLAALCDAYIEEDLGEGDVRTVLKFKPEVAPYKVAVMPLQKKGGLKEKAQEIFDDLTKQWSTDYDEAGSIGKRYRRADEIGTPYCVTVDYDTLEDGMVTVRDRDTMEQERIKIEELNDFLRGKVFA